MRVHRRSTYQSGADRMLVDDRWHSSTPLDSVQPGDILRVKNKDTLEVVDWEVTEPSTSLSPEEARLEWLECPFGNPRAAERHGYFPFVLRNLKKAREYPPTKPSPRYIPSEVRVRVWLRDGGKCKRCGKKEGLEFDHIIPVSKGGGNSEGNIELLCGPCNRKKTGKIQ